MATRPNPGKCVHCLIEGKRDWDHVFPVSWYPESTPPNLEKWQIPSCIPCNRAYGKLESDLFSRFAVSLDPEHPASKSVVQTALRSMSPEAGRDPRDAHHRLKVRQKVIAATLRGGEIPVEAVIPGMGNRWNLPTDKQVAVLIPAQSLRRMTEKIVRGIFYIEDGKLIELPYAIDFFLLDDEADAAHYWKEALDKFSSVYARQPGIVVRRAVAPDDNISSLFEIEFWKHFKTYASITKGGRRSTR